MILEYSIQNKALALVGFFGKWPWNDHSNSADIAGSGRTGRLRAGGSWSYDFNPGKWGWGSFSENCYTNGLDKYCLEFNVSILQAILMVFTQKSHHLTTMSRFEGPIGNCAN
jgi:hypothetical protein